MATTSLPSYPNYVIGIDGGGTSTRAILADFEGRVLGLGKGGVSNYQHAGIDGATESVQTAISGAFESAELPLDTVAALFLGMAGVSAESDIKALRQLADAIDIAAPEATVIDHDVRIALTGGLAGQPGIALIAGTGSSCYGRTETGESYRCGGWGSIGDDVGSSTWIGLQAMQLAVFQSDGRLEGSQYRDPIFRYLGVDDIRDYPYRVLIQGISRTEIAQQCRVVVEQLKLGDPEARRLANQACEDLSLMIAVTAQKLGMECPQVVLTGGLATSGAPFQPLLEEAIMKKLPGADIVEARFDATAGAAIEALKVAGIPISDTVIHNLSQPRQTCHA